MNFDTRDIKASNNDNTVGVWDVEDVDFSGYESVAPFYLFRLKEMMDWATELWSDGNHRDVDLVLTGDGTDGCLCLVNREKGEVMVSTPVELDGPGFFEYLAMLEDDRETSQQGGTDGLRQESSQTED